MATISEIRRELSEIRPEERQLFIEKYRSDTRSGVVKLVESCRNQINREEKEAERLENMLFYEKKYYESCEYICGIDEAGRGPLAGPVVAGAVILPKGLKIPYLNDSKQLSEKRREELFDIIMNRALAVGTGIVSPERIDEINILQATYEAMRQAVGHLKFRPDILLNDAVIIPGLDVPQEKIIKGDAKSLSIAAASVIAKVTRDRMMKAYHEIFPEYGFDKHKGYGSKEHIEKIQAIGPCPIHRRSFITHFI
ncbi:ribonuclease HII [Frisingicoccus sp.]|uniref:ribonuclease HII n=1 Tax=Frisingicoccus sp. TaxID=1918627 RepID=UPI003AB4F192